MNTLHNIADKMKSLFVGAAALLAISVTTHQAQAQEHYGNTLNLGVGLGYYGYLDGVSTPFILGNYEFDVARQFTLAPSVGFVSFTSPRYYGGRYRYRQTVIPIGVKGTYYFDRLLDAGSAWDFYLAGSLGFNINRVVWDDGYTGDRDLYRTTSPLFLDLHIGTEYHFNKKLGMFLDLSTGISSLGLAIHTR